MGIEWIKLSLTIKEKQSDTESSNRSKDVKMKKEDLRHMSIRKAFIRMAKKIDAWSEEQLDEDVYGTSDGDLEDHF